MEQALNDSCETLGDKLSSVCAPPSVCGGLVEDGKKKRMAVTGKDTGGGAHTYSVFEVASPLLIHTTYSAQATVCKIWCEWARTAPTWLAGVPYSARERYSAIS
jgi:hypothetical protein